MTKRIILLSVFAFSVFSAYAQEKKVWHNKQCAVVLTYDDALNVHLDNAIPALDSLGLKGTFYLSGFFPGFRERVSDWAAVVKNGHELGNHTLFHPCEGKSPGREWVKPDYDLSEYTIRRIVDEIQMANTLLQTMDGNTTRTFAYPCSDKKAGDSSYVDYLRDDFIAARSVWGEIKKIDEIDLYDIPSYMINGQSAEEMIALVKNAMQQGALVVFLFHGVGGEHNLNVSLSDHRMLLRFLKQQEKDIWVAPMVEIAGYIKEKRTVSGSKKISSSIQ